MEGISDGVWMPVAGASAGAGISGGSKEVMWIDPVKRIEEDI
jgi:hypothetical protein